jgi:hypothetical protein
MKTILSALVIFILAGQSAAQTPPPELIRYADLILHNGKVLTAATR